MDFDFATALPVLDRTPHVLRALLDGLPPEWTDADEGPGRWSPRVVVAHLVHVERVNWVPRARLLIEHGTARPFPPLDPDAQFSTPLDPGSAGLPLVAQPLDTLLAAFAAARAESLVALGAWRTGVDLSREGVHPTFGVVTLAQLLAAWVAHDLAHVGQVARVMAKQYRDAVGPWRAFLPILDR